MTTRVLAVDPGALRLGWALLDDGGDPYRYIESGIYGIERGDDEPFQGYRDRLRDYWRALSPTLVERTAPDVLVAELLPAVGAGNFIAATQSELAKTAFLILELEALRQGVRVERIAANTIKKRLTGSGKATKVRVRNAVCEVLPELLSRKADWTTIFDEPDAIGVGLVALGYKHNGRTNRRTAA